jgi:hypothetical protein
VGFVESGSGVDIKADNYYYSSFVYLIDERGGPSSKTSGYNYKGARHGQLHQPKLTDWYSRKPLKDSTINISSARRNNKKRFKTLARYPWLAMHVWNLVYIFDAPLTGNNVYCKE